MRSPLRIVPAELNQIITAGVDEYMLEIRRAQRLMLQQVVINACQALGRPVFEGNEMESYIDVLEALIEAGHDDPDQIRQLTHELPFPPDGKLSSHRILLHLEPHFATAEPLVTNEDLDQYRFEVTGKIFTRCAKCRRGYHWTAQEFMLRHNVFLRRVLIGGLEPCPFCHTGHIRVYGVRAVLRDHTLSSQESSTVTQKRLEMS